MPRTHGLSQKNGQKRPEYQSWNNMHQRCNNPQNPKYPIYGGRGIKVCKRWSGPSGFATFWSDMGDRPADKKSIDRIDTNGDYEPDNCRWASAKEQYASQRIKGRTKLTVEQVRAIRADPRRPQRLIAADYGVNRSMISSIIRGDFWKDV
jgi:hypothetical protein